MANIIEGDLWWILRPSLQLGNFNILGSIFYNHLTWEGFSLPPVPKHVCCGLEEGRYPLHEKYPNTEVFLVRIFLHSNWIRSTSYFFVFSLNAEKYGPEKTPYLDTFHVVFVRKNSVPGHFSRSVCFSSLTKLVPLSDLQDLLFPLLAKNHLRGRMKDSVDKSPAICE